MKEIKCKICGRKASELDECRFDAKKFNTDVNSYIKGHDSTYNPKTKKFQCSECISKYGLKEG